VTIFHGLRDYEPDPRPPWPRAAVAAARRVAEAAVALAFGAIVWFALVVT